MRRTHCRTRLLLECSTIYRVKISVGVNMGFRFMARMVVVVRPVVTRVIMAVHLSVMGMFVGVPMGVVMACKCLFSCFPSKNKLGQTALMFTLIGYLQGEQDGFRTKGLRNKNAGGVDGDLRFVGDRSPCR